MLLPDRNCQDLEFSTLHKVSTRLATGSRRGMETNLSDDSTYIVFLGGSVGEETACNAGPDGLRSIGLQRVGHT